MFVQIDERPKFKLRWATPLLILVMAAVALFEYSLDTKSQLRFMQHWGAVPEKLAAAVEVPDRHLLTPITALFVHIDLAHLLGNALFLGLFGLAVEKVFRSRLVLVMFLLCGAIANLAAALLLVNKGAPIVGASGAVSGLIGAYLFLFPSASLGIVLPLGLYFHFTRVPASALIGLWFLLQLLHTFADGSKAGTVATTAWLAHVIGFIAGWSLAMVLKPLLYSNARARILQ